MVEKRLIVNYDFQGISKSFGMEEFGKKMEDAYSALGRESKFTQKTSFAPSGLGYKGNCPRYWYYAFNGEVFDNDKDALAQANMEYGTEAGKRIANLLDQAGILVEAEVPINHDDPPIGGFMDALVKWQGEEIACEVKTTKQETFNFRRNQMKAPGYQLIQLLIYMRVFKKDKGFFIVENKNTGEWLVLPIKMTDEYNDLVDRVFDWMRKVHKNALEGELPKRPYTKSSIPCKTCPVFDTCWDGWTRETKTRKGTDPNPGTVDLPPLELPK